MAGKKKTDKGFKTEVDRALASFERGIAKETDTREVKVNKFTLDEVATARLRRLMDRLETDSAEEVMRRALILFEELTIRKDIELGRRTI